jgi:hypothetical protein
VQSTLASLKTLSLPRFRQNYRSQSGGKDQKGSAVTSNKSIGQSSSDSTARLASGSGDGKAKELPDCLNPALSAKHFLKNCTVTSQERKDQLYAERAAARKSAGVQRETRWHAQTMPAPATTGADVRATTAKAVSFGDQATDGRIPISFGTDAKYVALPDIGADDNVLPRALLKFLEDSGMFVPLRTLPQPLAVEIAVKDPKVEVQLTQQAQLTVKLLFPAGPLRLRNVYWLVAENDMDEILVGRPLLKELGLDAPEHLAAVREEFRDRDCADAPTAAGSRQRKIVTHDAG